LFSNCPSVDIIQTIFYTGRNGVHIIRSYKINAQIKDFKGVLTGSDQVSKAYALKTKIRKAEDMAYCMIEISLKEIITFSAILMQ
jgi:hypothetical protein